MHILAIGFWQGALIFVVILIILFVARMLRR